jgi:hypothetical protein
VAGINIAAAVQVYSHGLPCAVEVLNFLIDCIAQRRLDGDGSTSAGLASSPADDEYAMFGLSMVHRALLAGGCMLHRHDALLSLLHKDLFAAMVIAVRGAQARRGACRHVAGLHGWLLLNQSMWTY